MFPSPVNWLKQVKLQASTTSTVNQEAFVLMKKTNFTETLGHYLLFENLPFTFNLMQYTYISSSNKLDSHYISAVVHVSSFTPMSSEAQGESSKDKGFELTQGREKEIEVHDSVICEGTNEEQTEERRK